MKPLHVLILVTATNHINFVGSRLAVLLYAVQLNASPATIGILTALFSLLGVTTSVATGRWIDRVGPRRPMLYFSLLMSTGSITAFFWDHLAALFIVSIMVGTCYNVYFVGNQTQLGRYGEAKDRVANFSLAMQGYATASFIAPLITGFAIDEIGYAYTFLLLSALPLVPAAVIGFNKVEFSGGPKPQSKPAPVAPGGVWTLLRLRKLRVVLIAALLSSVGWNLYTFLFPVYGAQIHLSASQIGVIVSTFSFASVVSRMFAPMLSRRYTAWQILLGSLVMAAAGFAVSPFFSNVPVLVALAFWLGLALGIGAPMSLALIYDASPPERMGEVQGLRLSLINGLQTVVPLTAGFIGAALGVGPVFWAVAVMLAAGTYAIREQWHTPRGKGSLG